jgi:hypothetical protein
LLKALGILERGHIVETDRQGLVAGFVGQTAIKTAEKVEQALGGVLQSPVVDPRPRLVAPKVCGSTARTYP